MAQKRRPCNLMELTLEDGILVLKVEPEEEDDESARYRSYLFHKLRIDKKFWFGVSIRGYDTSLSVDEVESALTKHFSSCGEMTHVFVSTLDKKTNIYFSQQEVEARALDLHGSKFPISAGPAGMGYSVPAHMIEFAGEIDDKVIVLKKERRLLVWKFLSRED